LPLLRETGHNVYTITARSGEVDEGTMSGRGKDAGDKCGGEGWYSSRRGSSQACAPSPCHITTEIIRNMLFYYH